MDRAGHYPIGYCANSRDAQSGVHSDQGDISQLIKGDFMRLNLSATQLWDPSEILLPPYRGGREISEGDANRKLTVSALAEPTLMCHHNPPGDHTGDGLSG